MESADRTERIAIACFGEEVAPCFETARRFRLWVIADGRVSDYRELAIEEPDGLMRVRRLREVQAGVVLCNGISQAYRQMLEADGRVVIDQVVGPAADVVFGYLSGRIAPRRDDPLAVSRPDAADLVAWAREWFESCGWTVRPVGQESLFPVDFAAERVCPTCGKPARVAVCCGAHAWRVDEEIREFKRVAAGGYDGRVYLHTPSPAVARLCADLDIQLLEPHDFTSGRADDKRRGPFAPLKQPPNGHAHQTRPEDAKQRRSRR
ncbi:MAG: hypothetical protein C4523_19500 [Myxococcales bacterium]|nr:MAG: hypothetical protein C4523_19500 [Myxococcales bacterium]